jgi:hypothetical protein
MPRQLLSEEAKSRAGHVHAGRVNEHVKPLVEVVLLVENPSTRGLTALAAQLPGSASSLANAHCWTGVAWGLSAHAATVSLRCGSKECRVRPELCRHCSVSSPR